MRFKKWSGKEKGVDQEKRAHQKNKTKKRAD